MICIHVTTHTTSISEYTQTMLTKKSKQTYNKYINNTCKIIISGKESYLVSAVIHKPVYKYTQKGNLH